MGIWYGGGVVMLFAIWRYLAIGFILAASLAAGLGIAAPLAPDIRSRLRDDLASKVEDGKIYRHRITPLMVASFRAVPENREAQLNEFMALLRDSLGGPIIQCASCDSGQVTQSEAGVHYVLGAPTLAELRAFDLARTGAEGKAAKAAVYAESAAGSLSYRIVDLESGEVLVAATISPEHDYESRSERFFTMRRQLNRQARGESIRQNFFDLGIYPKPHLGYSWLEQWGANNQYLTGFAMSFAEPMLGVGVGSYRVLPSMGNMLVGGKILASLPQLLGNAAGGETASGDQTYTVVGMIRYPLSASTSSMGIAYITSNGALGLGVSF